MGAYLQYNFHTFVFVWKLPSLPFEIQYVGAYLEERKHNKALEMIATTIESILFLGQDTDEMNLVLYDVLTFTPLV